MPSILWRTRGGSSRSPSTFTAATSTVGRAPNGISTLSRSARATLSGRIDFLKRPTPVGSPSADEPIAEGGIPLSDTAPRRRIPRDPTNDYTHEAAAARRTFVEQQTGVALEHVGRYSFEPNVLPGNIENFIGVAQVPIGVAGPLRI